MQESRKNPDAGAPGRPALLGLWGVLLCVAVRCGAQAAPQDRRAPAPKPPVETRPVPPTPIAVEKVKLGEGDPWNPAWTRMIERALPRGLLSKKRAAAVAPLCPRFGSMSRANRRAFWAYFFQALAGAEAGLKTTADVKHNEPEVAVIDRVTHRTVRQEGLLQLTYMDSVRYGCRFSWARDKYLPEHDPAKSILQPRNNLLCGIKILRNQLIKQHQPLLSESSYWVTLRPGHPSFMIFVKQMANVPAACRLPPRKPVLLPAAEARSKNPELRRQAQPANAAAGDPRPESSSDPAQK